jgi:CIC family chloride channel protein
MNLARLRRPLRHDPRAFAQANVGGLAAYTPKFWAMVVLTGVAAGLGAIVMMLVLHAVQHAAFAYLTGEYSSAAAAHSDLRRVVVVLVGGVVAGGGYWLIRTRLGGTGGEATRAVWSGGGELSPWRAALTGALSEVVIGLGASIGREAAPQQTGAAFGSWLGRRFALPREQMLLLIACGAGSGVGAVYNVPLAGALFAAELYLSSISLATVVPALVSSAIATAIGWIYLPQTPIYPVPALHYPGASLIFFALLAGPLLGLAAASFVKLIVWASDHRPSGRALLVSPPIAFAVLAALAIPYPLLLGNGRDLALFAFRRPDALIGTLLAMAALKPVVTALCLRSGASGGLFTPTFSTGAVIGALLGHIWAHIWPGASVEACAVAGAGAMLGAAMRAPIAAVAFTLELTGAANPGLVLILLALGGAMLVARGLERRSIYTARLPASSRPSAPPRHGGTGAGPGASAGVRPDGDRAGGEGDPTPPAGHEPGARGGARG